MDLVGWRPRQKLAVTFPVMKERVSETHCTHTCSLGNHVVSRLLPACQSALLLVFLTGTTLGGRIWWRAFFTSWLRENYSFSTAINRHTHTVTLFWPSPLQFTKCFHAYFLDPWITQRGDGASAIHFTDEKSETQNNIGHLPNIPKVKGNSGLPQTYICWWQTSYVLPFKGNPTFFLLN